MHTGKKEKNGHLYLADSWIFSCLHNTDVYESSLGIVSVLLHLSKKYVIQTIIYSHGIMTGFVCT